MIKLSDYCILFSMLLTVCILFSFTTLMLTTAALHKNYQYQRILERAVEDGASYLIEEMDKNGLPIWNLDLAAEVFFESIYASLGQLGTGFEDPNVLLEVPVIMAVDKDGVWVYGLEEAQVADHRTMGYKWSDKFFFNEENSNSSYILQIQEILESYINRHNLIARQYGIHYQSYLPELNDEFWGRTIDGFSMIAFYQGKPISLFKKTYPVYAFSASRIYEGENGYLVQNGYYHRGNCSQIESAKVEQYLSLKSSCALYGAFPCEICNP